MGAHQVPAYAAGDVEVAVLSMREQLLAIRADWDRLAAARTRDGIFRSYLWNVLWLEHVAPLATPHVVTITARGGEVIGLAPLCETVHRDRLFRLPSIGFMGRDTVSGDFLGFLAAPGCEALVVDRVLEHLTGIAETGRLLVLGELVQGSQTARAVEAWTRAHNLHTYSQEFRTCPYIELPDGFEHYLASLSKNTRSNLRRRTRQLKKRGCKLELCKGPREVLPRIHHLYDLHEARWNSVGETGNFGRPGFRKFVEDFIEQSAAELDTMLYLVGSNGVPVAAQLCFRWGRATHFYQGGLDPDSDLARMSPGLVLFGCSIADAIEAGCRHYEFLRGDEPYKRTLAPDARTTKTLLVSGRGLRAQTYLCALRLKDRAKAAWGLFRRSAL